MPALALTGLLYAAGLWRWGRDEQTVYDHPWLRLAVSALFLNQNWNLTIAALTNGPYWSLCYEVWYYVMFGVAVFGHPRWRWWALAAVMLLAGPRILLLAPMWLLGALLYLRWIRHAQHKTDPPRPLAFALALTAFIVVLFGPDPAAALSQVVRSSLDDGHWHIGGFRVFIGGDWRFPSDYVLAVLFALSVRYSSSIGPWIARMPRFTATIRAVSAYTFSVYLFHAPLLVFLHPAGQRWLPAAVVPWMMMALLLASVVLLGHFTERRKAPWTRMFSYLLGIARQKKALPFRRLPDDRAAGPTPSGAHAHSHPGPPDA